MLDVIEEEGLVERAAAIGETIRARMLRWQERWRRSATCAASARCSRSSSSTTATKEPAAELASAVVEAAPERGLLLLKSGIYSNCIRVLCPLVITDAELDEALGVWEEALEPRSAADPRAGRRHRGDVVGEVVADRYELEELVGTGGMSSVYRAHDRCSSATSR